MDQVSPLIRSNFVQVFIKVDELWGRVNRGKLIKSSFERLMLKHDYPYQSKPIFFVEVGEVFKKDSYLLRTLNK